MCSWQQLVCQKQVGLADMLALSELGIMGRWGANFHSPIKIVQSEERMEPTMHEGIEGQSKINSVTCMTPAKRSYSMENAIHGGYQRRLHCRQQTYHFIFMICRDPRNRGVSWVGVLPGWQSMQARWEPPLEFCELLCFSLFVQLHLFNDLTSTSTP